MEKPTAVAGISAQNASTEEIAEELLILEKIQYDTRSKFVLEAGNE